MALDPFSVIGSALHSYLGTAGTIPAYQDLAPQGSAPPYIVYSFQSGPQLYTWDGSEVQAVYQIKVVSNRTGPGEATRLYQEVHDALQDAPLAVANGVSLLRCRRITPIRFQDPKLAWHVGGLYRIDILADGV